MTVPQLTPAPISNDDSLLLALFVAALLHAITLYIEFDAPQPNRPSRSMEITLSHSPLKNAPKTAKFLAADHQLGAGNQQQQPKPIAQKIPVLSETPPQPAVAAVKPDKQPGQEIKKPTPQKLLSQVQAPVKIAVPSETIDDEPTTEAVAEVKPRLSMETLQQQVAQVGEQNFNLQQSAENNKIKFVNSVSTHKSLAAQYDTDWKNKIERTGASNFPEAARARNKGEKYMLTMEIGINADGSINRMRITKPSGNPALDEAAKRIVTMSAPFAKLPAELLKELNVLVITKTWTFSDPSDMMSAH